MSKVAETEERTNLSQLERRRPAVRIGFAALTTVVVAFLVLACAGPLIVLAKWATSSSQDIISDPFGWWPSGVVWSNLNTALFQIGIGQNFLNTLWVVLGSWIIGLSVAVTGGYVIAILRPWYARFLNAAILATLFIPGIISLVPLYLTILHVPVLGVNLLNSFWAVWLPAGAHAFNVLLVTRFFRSLPSEVFEAAKVDGAGPFRVLFSLVLPMSRPILGVASLLMIVASWKDFLWPLLVLPSTSVQPLAVALPQLETTTTMGVLMASLFIATIVPVLLFLVFQRQFLRNAGQAGALKA